jgi:hypothetical protein
MKKIERRFDFEASPAYIGYTGFPEIDVSGIMDQRTGLCDLRTVDKNIAFHDERPRELSAFYQPFCNEYLVKPFFQS